MPHAITTAPRRKIQRDDRAFRFWQCTGKRRFCIALALLGCSLGRQAAARTTEIWFGGLDPVTRAAHKDGGPSDFLDLFAPNADWAKAASKVNVFKLSTQFLLKASDDELSKVIAGLKARKIALAAAVGLLSGDGHCGWHMEGFSAPRTGVALAERVRRLGGDLRYIAMDEPLWFGKYANDPRACHSSMNDITKEIAEKSAQIRHVFPDVQIGDTEPIGMATSPSWPQELQAWVRAYRSATGINLAFLHADIQWRADWQPQLRAVAKAAVAERIPLGVIVDSDRPVNSGAEWVAHAEQGLTTVRSVLDGLPDQLIFQSWSVYPKRYLPDDQSGTLTNLVVRFRD